MRRSNLKWMVLVLGFCLVSSRTVQADQTANTGSTPQLVLTVQTANGKALQAPVVKFKALSLAVIKTLIKEGKLSPSRAPENDPSGNMTFYLDNNVSADFVNWVKSSLGQSESKDSGEFIWPSQRGIPGETFKMQGLKVVGFIPADKSNGIELVLAADKTEAFPPLDFSKGEK